MSHRYLIGDEVRLAFGFFDRDAAGTYGVTRLLPTAMDGEPQYRIKDKDGRERVIGEGQIARESLAEQTRPRSPFNPITDMFNRIDQAAASAADLQQGAQDSGRVGQDPTT